MGKGSDDTNIIAGFRTMGSAVYLRGYHGVPKKRQSLTQRTGLQFILMFSSLKSAHTSPKPPVFDFGDMKLYKRWYKKGYNVPDKWYE